MPAKTFEEKAAPATAPKEKLLSARIGASFMDGNLCAFFAEYGYACEWPAGEVRKIPYWLVERVQSSGGEIELMR